MTEPIDPSDTEPETPAAVPDAAVQAEVPAQGLSEAPPSGWVAPAAGRGGGSRRTRGCVILVVFVGVLLVVGYVGLVFLGNQARAILAGTIEFGTGGTGCSVTEPATTFPASAAIHSVAYLPRDTRVGETITVAVTYPDGTTETNDEAAGQVASCVTQEISPGLAPGHYALQYRSASEVLATGGFDITP
jgi:hypothetical protein